jgi:UDP-4-amino-4,6-dideoxy-N-acetyl-beta-L-altrosamine transaminase
VELIPYGRQSINETDIEAVVQVLRSDFLTQGSTVPAFEEAISQKVNFQHGVAVNSATSALHVACLALELGPGDWLWTVPNTFVASANCARYCGAQVDFVDIDPKTWNLSALALEEKLSHHRKEGKPLPKVLVPVHFSGQPTDQEQIWELAQEFGFRVLEDASHSIGAQRNGEPVGSCRWSDITVFSFHPVKIITSGEGGLALTNDSELAWKMGTLRSHGITRDEDRLEQESLGPWYYEQQTLGFNYRMTDLQAALGLSQLERLDEFVGRRNQLAQRYDELLAELPIQRPTILKGNLSSFHLYVIRLPTREHPERHRKVFERLRQAGIGVNLHYMPVHLQPDYRRLGFREGMFPEAEAYGREAISLPLFPSMTEEQQDRVVNELKQSLC